MPPACEDVRNQHGQNESPRQESLAFPALPQGNIDCVRGNGIWLDVECLETLWERGALRRCRPRRARWTLRSRRLWRRSRTRQQRQFEVDLLIARRSADGQLVSTRREPREEGRELIGRVSHDPDRIAPITIGRRGALQRAGDVDSDGDAWQRNAAARDASLDTAQRRNWWPSRRALILGAGPRRDKQGNTQPEPKRQGSSRQAEQSPSRLPHLPLHRHLRHGDLRHGRIKKFGGVRAADMSWRQRNVLHA